MQRIIFLGFDQRHSRRGIIFLQKPYLVCYLQYLTQRIFYSHIYHKSDIWNVSNVQSAVPLWINSVFLKKVKTHLPCPLSHSSHTCPRKTKVLCPYKESYKKMFTAAFFMTANTWKTNPMFTNRRMDKQLMGYPFNGIALSNKKELWYNETAWISLKIIMQNERSQANEKYILFHLYESIESLNWSKATKKKKKVQLSGRTKKQVHELVVIVSQVHTYVKT